MRRIGLFIAATCAAISSAPAALAAPVLVADDQSRVTEVALQDAGVAFLATTPQARRRGKDAALMMAAPGSRPRSVALLGSFADDGTYSEGVSASGLTVSGGRAGFTLFGWSEAADKYAQGDYPRPGYADLIDLGTGAVSVARTCTGPPPPIAALAGSLVATSGCAGGAVELRDLDRPQEAPRTFGEKVSSVRLVGRKLAWRDDKGFSVVDVDTGVASRVEHSSIPETIVLWALQADGTLAFGTTPPNRFVIGAEKIWIARPGGAPTELADPSTFTELELASDRIVYTPQAPSAQGGRDLVLQPTDGSAPRVLAHTGEIFDLDFDGTRIAYSAGGCGEGSRVFLQPGDDAAPADLTVNRCPADIDYSEVDRRGRLRVSVSCPALSPALVTDRCTFKGTARARGVRLGRSSRIRGGMLTWSANRRLLRKRPRRIRVSVAVRMRGGTERVTETVNPTYPKRKR